MSALVRGVAALLLICATGIAGALAQTPAREVHGTSDTYAGNGVAVAWAVLRGVTEDATQVIVRVAADPQRFDRIAAEGVDPFSNTRQPAASARPIGTHTDLRFPRTRFADFPRTDLAFTGTGAPLVVYYLGVPDTTPEFAEAAAMEAHLAARLATLRAAKDRARP